MIFFDFILIAISCISIPLIVAVMLDIFYAERKKVRFSLRRTSVWYMCVFALSFIPAVLLVTQLA
ncbi:hypothetical protein FCT18_10125 [Lysinibacillus sphaericus]|uniref:Uncharacterized protein n=3 Tax=Lysinibacillus TaxID=400634 RepID=A0A2S0JW60_LYSSH|nr:MULTISPECIES: hypothetical protein [Lysinibacillus]AHN23375.1 hypothetical protein T479_20700 [Lysinibacillus varians]AVK95372.1 hypothetical protein LS41612_03290 [Lysinibacillus sphaericus]MCS1383179.1 hypothetical protein [Lysinibacillus sphaericus]MED4546263.1 hypothetical protein [Lysinibacillus sphaericus]TKI19373.1 hypothetical protein FCT18_10125 [Lysinibacillus sphaericus]